jgi:molecular chaperone HtpG
VLGTLKAKSEKGIKEYELFWKNFREVLKEGLCDNMLEEKTMLLEICKFQSTTSGDNFINLDQYISNMTEEQDKIYFLNGNNLEELKKNPQLEGFKKRGIEVLLLNDHVDNFWVNVVRQTQKLST